MRQYIGARYVPRFSEVNNGIWSNVYSYEPLTIVKHDNDYYTSKKSVPVGVAITDTEYWVLTGNYNGAISNLQDQINDINGELGNIIGDDVSLTAARTITGTNYSLNDSTITGNSSGRYLVDDGSLKGANYNTAADIGLTVKNKATITENAINNSGSQGVSVDQVSSKVLITDNDIESKTYPVLINENAGGSGAIIDANFIKSRTGDAIELNNPNGLFKDIAVANNILDAGADGGSGHASGFAVGIAKGENIAVSGNVSKYSRQEGLHIENEGKHIVVNGNVFDKCQTDGAWIQQKYSKEYSQNGDVVIHANNRYAGNGSGNGLNVIYDVDADDNITIDRNNIYSGFSVGILNRGSNGRSKHRVFDDTILNCDIGIKTSQDMYGHIVIDNALECVQVLGTQNRVTIDDLNIIHAPAYTNIITFEDTGHQSRAYLKNFTIEKDVASAASDDILPIPLYAKGQLILRAFNPYRTMRVYEIDGTTLTQLFSDGLGSVIVSPSFTANALNVSFGSSPYTGLYKIEFNGVYIIGS